MNGLLFHGRGALHDFLVSRRDSISQEIQGFDADYLLKVSETDLAEYLIDKYKLEPPAILDDEIHQLEPQDTEFRVEHPYRDSRATRVKGTEFQIVVPFSGDATLFYYQPSRYTLNPPRGEAYEHRLVLTYQVQQPDARRLQHTISRTLDEIREYLGWVATDVERFNNLLSREISTGIARRREKLLADRKVSESLGIPLKRREDAPRTYVVPDVRRKTSVRRPKVSTEEPFAPEPELSDAEYEFILSTMRDMARVLELNPRAFAEMGEEDLRTQFLVPLNAQYEGQATGETFNFQGKTDILVKVEGRNIFIAECKFWRGPKSLSATVDQLLSYLSWRDTKSAILLFNRNRDLTKVLDQIPGVLEQHPCYKQAVDIRHETDFRYVLHQPGDRNRQVVLTILVFDVPRPE
jgi:hypothetical protein